VEGELVCIRGQLAIEHVGEAGGELRALDDESHLGIQLGGARIEIERSDEDTRSVDGECLGVEARARASDSHGADRMRDASRSQLPQLHARIEEGAPALCITGVNDRDVGGLE
jgi:hypothetical protein